MESNEGVQKPYNFLKKPLRIKDLTGPGVLFDFNHDFGDIADNICDELNLGSDDDDESSAISNKKEPNISPSPWIHSFEDLREKMVKINEFLYKDVTIEAKNEKKEKGLVPENARVCIRYSAYWEGEGKPFDSSFMRGTAFTFVTGIGEVLEGLESAVRTMYEGESATFLISYKLLFLELGCPPRIKPRADGLFTIEVIKFNLVGDNNAVEKLSEDDKNKFSVLIDKVKLLHMKGLDYFKQGFYTNACSTFERCVDALTFSRLANEKEENEQREFLIKLYTNLAICYIKKNTPSKTCIMVREIKSLTNNKPSCKVVFQEGRALLMLGEFKLARECLKRAQRMEPANATILKELRILNENFIQYNNSQREIWTKAIGIVNKSNKNVADKDEKTRTRANIAKMLQQFKDNEDYKQMEVPSSMTLNNAKIVTELCEQMDITLKCSSLDQNVYILEKKMCETPN